MNSCLLWICVIVSCSYGGPSVDAFISSSTSAASYTSKSNQSSSRTRLLPRRALISSVSQRGSRRYVSVGDEAMSVKKKSRKINKKKTKKKFHKKNPYFSKELGQAKAINKELINASSTKEILDLYISKGGAKGTAGGGVFNSVNFSTCLHRLARFANQHDNYNNRNQNGNNRGNNNKNSKRQTVDEKRKIVLSDPRTAILLASLSEAMIQPKSNKALMFNSRELANLGWAISKLKVAPPSKIYPVVRPANLLRKEGDEQNPGAEVVSSSLDDINKDILDTATRVRNQVLEVAKERSTMRSAAERATVKNKWIPALSQLSGKLLDVIAIQVMDILDDFNSQELANLLYAFASAGRADSILFDRLSERLVKNMKDKSNLFHKDMRKRPKPQEFSNSVWAFASAGLRGQGHINLIAGVADILDYKNGAIVPHFKPQELSNTAWGTATLLGKRKSDPSSNNQIEDDAALRILRWVAESLEERVDDFKPQEISNSIWAFATVGFGAASNASQMNTNNDYVSLQSDKIEEDRLLVARTLEIVAKSAMKRLPRFRPQELNNLSWGICRLGHYGKTMDLLFEGVGQELLKRHYYFKPQDIGTTLWSFATYEYFDENVYKAAASELTLRRSRSFKPQELSNTVWALATAGAIPQYAAAFDTTIIPQSKRPALSQVTNDPISECFAAATTELMRRPHHFKSQEIKDVLWSLSKAGIRHPGVFRSVAEHLVGKDARGMDDFSPQGLGNLAWAYAKQAQLGGGVNDSTIGSTGRLAVYETSCLDIGEELIQQLFDRIAKTSIQNLDRFKPQDLSNTCWAFATLGFLHNTFFNSVARQVCDRLSPTQKKSASNKFKAQEIANLVWSFATLNCKANGLIECFSPTIVQMCNNSKGQYDENIVARCFKRQEVANLAWSCAVLGEYPRPLMPILYTALFGKDCDGDPNYLNRIYGDDGIQKQAIMTMFYVQMAIQTEAPNLDLVLPTNFPVGWQAGEHRDKKKLLDETDTSMLQLTTSRLQQNISNKLKSVGFDHEVEHIISTDQLQNDYGVMLSSENQEFLSLDIANVDKMIGIEVDGPGHFVNIIDSEDNADRSTYSGGEMKTGKQTTGWEFTANVQQQVNGPTALKHRLMCHLGWSVGHIPYYEWREQEDEDEYCKKILNSL